MSLGRMALSTFILGPSGFYMLNSHKMFGLDSMSQYQQHTAQQFMHSLGYGNHGFGPHPSSHMHPQPHGPSEWDEPPPPYTEKPTNTYAPSHSHGGGWMSSSFNPFNLQQLQENVYSQFMHNLGLPTHQPGHGHAQQSAPWTSPFNPGMHVGLPQLYDNVYRNVYSGFMHGLGLDPNKHPAPDASHAAPFGGAGWAGFTFAPSAQPMPHATRPA